MTLWIGTSRNMDTAKAVTVMDAFNWKFQQATTLCTFEHDTLLETSGGMVK